MTPRQRNLYASTVFAVAAVLIAIFGLTWFHIRINLVDGVQVGDEIVTGATLHLRLHSVTGCVAGTCGREALGSDGAFPMLAGFTFWVSLLFAIVVAIQTALRATSGPSLTMLGAIGTILAVLGFGGTVVCGYLLAPSSAVGDLGAVTVHRTWAAVLLLVGYGAGAYALYLASADQDFASSERTLQPLVARAPIAPVVARTDDAIALDVEPEGERDPFLPPSD
ncbi:MAG: hypothetical protein ABI591_28050 [Kofleriaceae bacterium]